jgi:thiamine pyrophosphate-dependent acetolactate synthase large subunit-like protein
MLEGRQISELLAEQVAAAGGTLFFGVPGGGSNLDTVGALEAQGCQFVLVHTENAAGVIYIHLRL